MNPKKVEVMPCSAAASGAVLPSIRPHIHVSGDQVRKKGRRNIFRDPRADAYLQRRYVSASVMTLIQTRETVQTFLTYVKENSKRECKWLNPYKKYKMQCWDLDIITQDPIILEFLVVVGPDIEELTLERCYSKTELPLGFLKLVFEGTPNLEKLILLDNQFCWEKNVHVPIWEEKELSSLTTLKLIAMICMIKPKRNVTELEVKGQLPFNFCLMAGRLPNVQRVKIRSNKDEQDKQDDFRGKVCTGLFKYLRELDIMDPLQKFSFEYPQYMLDLADTMLPLHTLAVSVPSERDVEFNITIEAYRKRLRVLKVYKKITEDLDGDFPLFGIHSKMHALRELYVYGKVLVNFDFAKLMPNLQKFYLDVEAQDVWIAQNGRLDLEQDILQFGMNPQLVGMDLIKMSENIRRGRSISFNWSHLTYFHADIQMAQQSLIVLHKAAPGMKILHCVLSDAGLKIVCCLFRSLQELKVLYGNTVTDYGVAGKFDTIGGVEVETPDVSYLSNLKIFILEANCFKGILSDWSVYEGFLKMEKLEYLKIFACARLTKGAEIQLKRQIKFVQIIRNDRDGHYLECCERNNFPAYVMSMVELRNASSSRKNVIIAQE